MARYDFSGHDSSVMLKLRREIIDSPVAVAKHRAKIFTDIWQANEGASLIIRKALAMREYFRTVDLYLRDGDLLAGYISETPGAMPVYVELGIAENSIYISENPERAGYLTGQVDPDIDAYWLDRNLWGRYRAYMKQVFGRDISRTQSAGYKFISNQGHLSPAYTEVLEIGLGGLIEKIHRRRKNEIDPDKLEFLKAAEISIEGLVIWASRYGEFLSAESEKAASDQRRQQLSDLAAINTRLATSPPKSFHEAMQLIWLVHQAVHIEGHGYSNTPDRLDQLLIDYYRRDAAAGVINADKALTLFENFLLKQRDNSFWGNEHNVTQGMVVGGSAPDGRDQTNELSWMIIAATGNMSLPEPLVWLRWHPNIDGDFFDFCLKNLAGSTCFPLMMSDTVVPQMFMNLGVSETDAYNYVPCGCNELGIPGMAYFNPAAHAGYLGALEQAMTGGCGYKNQWPRDENLPEVGAIKSFEEFTGHIAAIMRRSMQQSYADGLTQLRAQMLWGQTPLTSCFFDGCIDGARDMTASTKYNILSCGGSAFANMVDSLAAIKDVVFDQKAATLVEVADACRNNFENNPQLRAKLMRAPKHGNDEPAIEEIVNIVQDMRDKPLKQICSDPRDGAAYVNSHVVRSSAVSAGRVTGATPDGRLAGTPLASSVAACCGAERSGPTALLNSILMLDAARSWQGGYNVNMRLSSPLLTRDESRKKVAQMLASYFNRGGQEMQINCVDTDQLRSAQKNPDQYRDLVVRVAGFSDFFVNLDPDIQEEVIARTEHGL